MNRRQPNRRQEHEYVLERLSPYMDEQLQVKERARVEAHLSACPSCRDELRTLQWTKGLLRQAPPVPLPRSFVIREADLAPQQARRWKPAFALQWATALVTLLLVVVVAGDLFLGGRLAAPGGQQEIAMLRGETPVVVETVVVESEILVEAPAPKAAQADAETETPAEGERRGIAPTTTAEDSAETSETFEQAQPMEQRAPVTGTTNVPLMMVQGTPEKSMPEEAAPVTSEGAAPPTEATPEQPDEKAVESPAETPPAIAALPAAPVETPPDQPATVEPSARPLWVRAGWRVAEVGLGLLLVGLIVALVWARRRNQPAA